VQDWCTPISLFRRLGVGTTQEIDHERYALKGLRGDFSRVQQGDSPSVEEALHSIHNP